jgi:hypothetical protein
MWKNLASLGGPIAGAALTIAGGLAGAPVLLILGALVFVAGLGFALVPAAGRASVFLAMAALAPLLGLTAALARSSNLGILAIALFVADMAAAALVAAAASSLQSPTAN